MGLADLDVLVIDCQSTGATPQLGELLEIGWARARASSAAEPVFTHCVALPDGRKIPRVVSRLTGLDGASLAGAIEPAEAWRRLRAAAAEVPSSLEQPVPTVIHFARFELAFLRDLQVRFAPETPFPFDVVCAHEIARRLFPDLPRRGLRALAGYFGHGLELERRSAGHVAATAMVWRHVAAELEARDVHGWSDLRAWLDTPAPRSSNGRRSFPLPRERRLSLPDAPGVYRFLRSNGDVLYVGKATSLRKRVSSHYSVSRAGDRALEMLTQARDVAVTVTASALEAALLETDEIKTLDPPYNVQLRQLERSAWFVAPDLVDGAPRPEGAGWIGPLPSRYAMAGLGAVIALASGAGIAPDLSARAVGVPPSFAPDGSSFAAGWASFVERHLAPVRSRTPRGVVLKASKALWRLWGDGGLDEGEDLADEPRVWDPDRVRRHLERRVLQGGQLLRRARWLCLLGWSSVAWREPGAALRRSVFVDGGEIVARRDLVDGEALPSPPRAPRAWQGRQLAFDAVRYDRLRVLATELKRVSAETGDVAVAVDDRRELRGESLARVLRWV